MMGDDMKMHTGRRLHLVCFLLYYIGITTPWVQSLHINQKHIN
jgi:hypothetical protein